MAKKGDRRGSGRARRVVGGLAATVAVLAAIAIVGPLLVPSSRLAPRVVEALAAATGTEVAVDQVRVTLAGGPGLALRGVHLALVPGSETVLEQASASLAVVPLLRRELVVDHVKACGPALRTNWQGQVLELDSYELDAKGLNLLVARLGGGTDATLPAATGPGLRLPADLAGQIRLKAARGTWLALALDDVVLEAQLDGRVITVASLVAACGDGRLEVSGAVDLSGPVPVLRDGRAGMQGLRAGALLGVWAPTVASQLEVRLDGAITAAGDLAGPDVLAGLVAEAHLGLTEGLVRAGPWLADVSPYLGDRQDLVDIRIDSGRLAVRLAEGKCLIDTLTTVGPDTDWDVAGQIALSGLPAAERTLDLAVHVRLPAGFTPVLGSMTFFAEAMRDTDRRVNLDLRVNGTLPEAAVTLDLAAMSRRARRS